MRLRTLLVVVVATGILAFSSCGETRGEPAADAHDGTALGRNHANRTRRNTHDRAARGADVQLVAIGDKVPDFTVTIGGKAWKLSELRRNKEMTVDGTLVLTFWCSFCHSCRDVEHPLDALAQRYKGKVGVIALDASAGETTEGVAKFAREVALSLPIALDSKGATADIFGVRATTTAVVIDKTGVLRYRGQFRDRQHAFAENALQAVLAGKPRPVSKSRGFATRSRTGNERPEPPRETGPSFDAVLSFEAVLPLDSPGRRGERRSAGEPRSKPPPPPPPPPATVPFRAASCAGFCDL